MTIQPTNIAAVGGGDHPTDNPLQAVEYAMQELVDIYSLLQAQGCPGNGNVPMTDAQIWAEITARGAQMSNDSVLMAAVLTSLQNRV